MPGNVMIFSAISFFLYGVRCILLWGTNNGIWLLEQHNHQDILGRWLWFISFEKLHPINIAL